MQLFSDLLIGNVEYEDVVYTEEGYTVDFTTTVTNTGTGTAEQPISLVLLDGNGNEADRIAVQGPLAPGQTVSVEDRFTLANIPGANTVYTVKVETNGDINSDNNETAITLARERYTVSLDDYAMFDDYYVLSVAVKNEGLFAAEPTLECRLDTNGGDLLFSDAYALQPGETTHVLIQIDANNIYFDTEEKNLYVQTAGSTNGFFFVLYAPHEHGWSEPEWTWNEEHTEATATFECAECMTEEMAEATVMETTGIGIVTYTATVTGPDGVTYTDVKTVVTNPYTAQIRAHTLTLEGKIQVNFYVSVSDDVLADEGSYALVTFNGKTTKHMVKDAPVSVKNGIVRRQFIQDVFAKQMRDEVTIEFYTGNDTRIAFYNQQGEAIPGAYTYSVMDYVAAANGSEVGEDLKDLVNRCAEYGTTAQIQFKYKAEGLTAPETAASVTINDLEYYAPVYRGELPEGITRNTSTLLLEADNTIRQYFYIGEGHEIGEYTFTQDGKAVMAKYDSEKDRYYLEETNIPAKRLDDVHTFTVTDGTTTYEIEFSALSYAYKALNAEGTEEALKNLVKLIYLYNQAANVYFNN